MPTDDDAPKPHTETIRCIEELTDAERAHDVGNLSPEQALEVVRQLRKFVALGVKLEWVPDSKRLLREAWVEMMKQAAPSIPAAALEQFDQRLSSWMIEEQYSVEPPAHPTSLGEVWVGTTRPQLTEEHLASLHRPASLDLAHEYELASTTKICVNVLRDEDGMALFAGDRVPRQGEIFLEFAETWKQLPFADPQIQRQSSAPTGRRFAYLATISPDEYDDDPKVRAECQGLYITTNPKDLTLACFRPLDGKPVVPAAPDPSIERAADELEALSAELRGKLGSSFIGPKPPGYYKQYGAPAEDLNRNSAPHAEAFDPGAHKVR